MSSFIRRLLIGRPFETARSHEERLSKTVALPIFASDALSSSAYATEEILFALMLAGTGAFAFSMPIAVAIVVLLVIVAVSYRQVVLAYPSGGGAYVVSRENLGVLPGTTAGAALCVDYVLTVSVSVAAGVAAITSALPQLRPYTVSLAVGFVWLLTLANLRGVRESGALFAIPSYGFILSMLFMLGLGAWQLFSHTPVSPPRYTPEEGHHAQNAFLILHAFASGCAALTGLEAISNGVQAFRAPEGKNAAITMGWLAGILAVLFLGITYFAREFQLVPVHLVANKPGETIVSQVAATIFGRGFWYHVIQAATAAILILAANTSFAGFPRLGAILARDRYLPRQLANIGDRLVYNNGIFMLAVLASILLIAFKGSVHALIPLYAIGVFLSFTLSQSGMVMRWWRRREEGWQRPATINAIGAATTAIVLLVLAVTKFREGAWVVVILIPVMVVGFFKIRRHYERISTALSMEGYVAPPPLRHTVLVLINTVHRGIMPALHYARSLGDVRGVYVEIHPEKTPEVERKWQQWVPDIPLVILPSPFRSLTAPVLDYIDVVQAEREDDILTVLLPEFDTPTLLAKFLHNQSGFRLKLALLAKPGVVVTNVRYHLTRSPARHIPAHFFQEPCPDLPQDAQPASPAPTRASPP